MSWIDIVVIGLILLLAIIGLAKGFFDGIISICSIFVSLLISVKASNWFAGVIRSIVDIDGWFDNLLVNQLGVGDSIIFLGVSYAREKVAAFLTVLLAGILLFIFIRMIIRLLKNLFTAATESSKALSGINKILGLALGVLKGGIIVSLALAVCSIVISLNLPGISETLNQNIQNTKVTSFIYKYVDEFVDQRIDGKSFEEIIEGLFDEEKAQQQENETELIVVYKDNSNIYKFTVGETVNYSDITVIYKPGANANTTTVEINASNFSEPINTDSEIAEKIISLTAFGKTVDFKYCVLPA